MRRIVSLLRLLGRQGTSIRTRHASGGPLGPVPARRDVRGSDPSRARLHAGGGVPACPALACGVLIAALSPLALATPYWVAFEGDTMPEEQPGWVRHWSGQYGGAQRWIETDPDGNNYLVIDSLASQMIYDFAEMDRPLNPTNPGEIFICEWKLLVAEHYGYRQEAVAIAPDQYGILGFGYTYTEIRGLEEGWSLPITPGVFHTYRVQSLDLVSYDLFIDDAFVRSGACYLNSLNQSFVAFGDGTQGAGSRSLSKWDFVRFGVVVPEPNAFLTRILLGTCACRVCRRS